MAASRCERVIHESEWKSIDPRRVLSDNKVLDLQDLLTKKNLKSLYVAGMENVTFLPLEKRVKLVA